MDYFPRFGAVAALEAIEMHKKARDAFEHEVMGKRVEVTLNQGHWIKRGMYKWKSAMSAMNREQKR
jgi:hypothetical protein